MRPYVSLHNHTTGSIGDSLITPKELIDTTKQLGQGSVAVTDHGSFSALWSAYKASKKSNVKLIAGCECYFVNDVTNNDNTTLRHIILLAKNAIGYKNLLTINKKGYDNYIVNFKKAVPRIDWKILEEYSEGIIATSACGNGILGQFIMADQMNEAILAAKKLKDIFGNNFAIELQPHNIQIRASAYNGPVNQQKINLALKQISSKLDIKCIVATDAHYVKKEHHKAHDVYLANASGQPITSGARLKYDKQELYMKTSDEVFEHFTRHMPVWGEQFVDSLFENTVLFADQCEIPDWIDPAVVTGEKNQLPQFPLQDESDYETFKQWEIEQNNNPGPLWKEDIEEDAKFYRYRSYKGLVDKISKGSVPEEDREECYTQMLEEFDVLEYRKFSSYMLITAHFLEWCRKNNIHIGPGRGSVGGSLTAYLNQIHEAYPKRYGLIFARFLNKYKDAMPDIDNDIAPNGRDLLKNHLREKYGINNVAHVSNINTITPKVFARDIARVFEYGGGRSEAAEIGNNIADSIPSDMKTVKQALAEAPLFAEYAKVYPELVEFAELLCGKPRAWSTHAGGIVISKCPLEGLVPLRRDTSGDLVLEYDKEQAEDNGLVKIDLLGLETLDIINKTHELISQNNKTIPEGFNYEINDKEAYKLIGEGDTFGVFQLGSTAVHVCKKVKPKDVSDIALISALVRPAAKDIIPNLLKVRNGEEEMKLAHPSLNRAFAKTYGFGLYEESLMYLALDVAGWDLHDADKLRKLTKEKGKNPEKVNQWKEEFIRDAIKNNISEEMATNIWVDTVQNFSGYGFNQSHATLYSMISFHTAYLKAHFPIEFLVSNLISEVKSNAKDSKENILKIKGELRNRKIKIVPPDVNTSDLSWKIVDDKTLMAGLDSLKYMGSDAIPELISKRPFNSFQDLIYRTDATKVRSPSIQALAASGSLDAFGMDRKQMFYYASDYRAKLRNHMGKLEKAWEKEWSKNNKLIKSSDDTWRDNNGNIQQIPLIPEDRAQEHLASFNYPFPEDKPWSVQDLFAMEEFYMGEGISGDVFERYPGFFDKKKTIPFDALCQMFPWERKEEEERANRKANTHYLGNYKIRPIEAIIMSIFSFIVKKEDSPIFGQEMARLTIQDPWGTESTLLCFPEAWAGMKQRFSELSGGKQKVDVSFAIRFLGLFQWENENSTSFVLSDILDYKAPPSLPEDRKSKKVKMPRSKKIKAKDICDMAQEDIFEELESEVLDEGYTIIEEE